MKHLTLATILLAACGTVAVAQQAAPQSGSTQVAPAAPALKSWFIKLIAPRPTFDKDMTEAETKVMGEHFAYWKDQFAKGVCVFGGPVLDPKGVYGVLALKAPTEEEARAIAEADPAAKAGVFKVEVAEMKIAFLPKGN